MLNVEAPNNNSQYIRLIKPATKSRTEKKLSDRDAINTDAQRLFWHEMNLFHFIQRTITAGEIDLHYKQIDIFDV